MGTERERSRERRSTPPASGLTPLPSQPEGLTGRESLITALFGSEIYRGRGLGPQNIGTAAEQRITYPLSRIANEWVVWPLVPITRQFVNEVNTAVPLGETARFTVRQHRGRVQYIWCASNTPDWTFRLYHDGFQIREVMVATAYANGFDHAPPEFFQLIDWNPTEETYGFIVQPPELFAGSVLIEMQNDVAGPNLLTYCQILLEYHNAIKPRRLPDGVFAVGP